jgi:hypothetical protein
MRHLLFCIIFFLSLSDIYADELIRIKETKDLKKLFKTRSNVLIVYAIESKFFTPHVTMFKEAGKIEKYKNINI